MAKEKEIEIRISSPMPFIDDDEEQEEEEEEKVEEEVSRDHKRVQYNVKITKNYQNKTRNIEITNELQDFDGSNDIDIITNRSLSPVAPLATDNEHLISEIHLNDTKLVHKQKLIKQDDALDVIQKPKEQPQTEHKGMQLIIKGNKSIISIQSFDNQSSITINTEDPPKKEEEKVYEFLNAEVSKIFKKPERHEIENAIKKVKNEKPKLLCKNFKNGDRKTKQKKGTWKILSKSLITMRGGKPKTERRGSDERYPKYVLLADPKKEKGKEEPKPPDQYPKMVMLDRKKSKKKFESPKKEKSAELRSKSLSYGPAKRKHSFRTRIKSLNEIQIEQHVIDMEKQHLEKEKTQLRGEKNVLQEEKNEIEKGKTELKKEKKHLNQEKQILDEKKHQIQEEKSLLTDRLPDDRALEMTIMGEEKMCLEIEKQLLSEEKHMLKEERDLLKKEKNVIEKERCLLGEEKTALEEEKTLLAKEKNVLERQKTFLIEQKFTDDERTGESEAEEEEESIDLSSESTAKPRKIKSEQEFHEIQDLFEDTLKLYPDMKYLGKPKYFDGEMPKRQRKSEGSSRTGMDDPPDSARRHHSPQPQFYDHYTSVPPQYCHDPYYYPTPLSYPSVYVPVYNTPRPFFRSAPNPRQCQTYCCNNGRAGRAQSQKNSTTQTNVTKIADSQMQTIDFPQNGTNFFRGNFNQDKDAKQEEGKANEEDVNLPNLPFGLLSSFFPRVVIMKTVHNNSDENIEDESKAKIIEIPKDPSPKRNGDSKSEVKGKQDEPVQEEEKFYTEIPTPKADVIDLLRIPTPDLSIKAVNVQKTRDEVEMEMDKDMLESDETETEESGINTGCTSDDIYMKSNDENCLSVKEILNKDADDGKEDAWEENSNESMSIENLHFGDGEVFDDESIRPNNLWEKEIDSGAKHMKEYENSRKQTKKSLTGTDKTKSLPLTKIGYKIYDKLTKLSLERENEIIEEAEVDRCAHNGNGIKKSPYNITFELNNRIIQVTVPEDNLNFEILNSGTNQMKIGVSSSTGTSSSSGNGEERDGVHVNLKQRTIGESGDVVIATDDKRVVRKSELWHPENRRKMVDNKPSDDVKIVFHEKDERFKDSINVKKDPQEISLSLSKDKEVILSIQMDDNQSNQRRGQGKTTNEVKIGTDDFDLAGGENYGYSDTNYKNLSPRTGQLLRSLQEKLESAESRKRASQMENNQRKMAMEQQRQPKENELMLPGIFLVRQISPRQKLSRGNNEMKLGARTESRSQDGRIREYYCEECLATMRVFEDDNRSVKNIVDKFETIIQLGTC